MRKFPRFETIAAGLRLIGSAAKNLAQTF